MPPLIRDVRKTEPLRGVGGFLQFLPSRTTTQSPAGEKLEVRQWEIWHSYVNARIAKSGNFGSISRRRVADDFTFAAILDLDLTVVRENEPGASANNQPHYDGRLEGLEGDLYQISMWFQCGDPTFWTHPKLLLVARWT